MTVLEQFYNNFHEELVSFEHNHSKLSKYITNIPKGSSAEKIFIRKRSLGITELLSFLIMPRAESLEVELQDFAAMARVSAVTKSALSQRRRNISEMLLQDLNVSLTDLYYDSPLPKKWKGRYIIAVDGSTLSMPAGKDFKEMFGVARHAQSGQERPTARAIFIVDVLNHNILRAELDDFTADESAMAWKAIDSLPNYIKAQSVFLFDRLYPSSWLLTMLFNNNIQFVMRFRQNFSPAVDRFFKSKQTYEDVKVEISRAAWSVKTARRYKAMNITQSETRPLYLHLTKSKLPSGEIEVIATHINHMRISAAQAYRLYGRRWGVETVIGQEKNEEQIEIFSGRTKQCVLQDFYSKVISHNLCQIGANEANKKLKRRPRATSEKSKVQPIKEHTQLGVNMNIAIYDFRNCCIGLLCFPTHRIVKKFLDAIIVNVTRIIPGRHFPRMFIHYKVSGKYVTFTNYGRAI